MRLLRKIIIILLLLISVLYLSSEVKARPMKKIAVIDGGFNLRIAPAETRAKLCKSGHFDFTRNKAMLGYQRDSHAVIVSNAIVKNIKHNNYCIVIYKVVGDRHNKLGTINAAVKRAFRKGLDAVNISLITNAYQEEFYRTIKTVMRRSKMYIFVAAGNDNRDLDKVCNMYPACYKINNPKFRVIGSVDYRFRSGYSNYGSIIHNYENGMQNGFFGTSFASPKALGKYINALEKR